MQPPLPPSLPLKAAVPLLLIGLSRGVVADAGGATVGLTVGEGGRLQEREVLRTLLRSRDHLTVANGRPAAAAEAKADGCFWRICFMSNCSLSSVNPTWPPRLPASRPGSPHRVAWLLWHCCNVWELPFGPLPTSVRPNNFYIWPNQIFGLKSTEYFGQNKILGQIPNAIF